MARSPNRKAELAPLRQVIVLIGLKAVGSSTLLQHISLPDGVQYLPRYGTLDTMAYQDRASTPGATFLERADFIARWRAGEFYRKNPPKRLKDDQMRTISGLFVRKEDFAAARAADQYSIFSCSYNSFLADFQNALWAGQLHESAFAFVHVLPPSLTVWRERLQAKYPERPGREMYGVVPAAAKQGVQERYVRGTAYTIVNETIKQGTRDLGVVLRDILTGEGGEVFRDPLARKRELFRIEPLARPSIHLDDD